MLEGISMQTMTLRNAAKHLGISKNKVWRAVKDGSLLAEEGIYKGQKALRVRLDDLEQWAKTWMESAEIPVPRIVRDTQTPPKRSEVPQGVSDARDESPHEHPEVLEGHFEVPEGASSFKHSGSSFGESSLRFDLVQALERSHCELRRVERRTIELELQLKQHQLLLTENSESIVEREARVKEAEAKMSEAEVFAQEAFEERDMARAEATQAKAEAELLKAQLAQLEEEKEHLATEQAKPWWKKMFG